MALSHCRLTMAQDALQVQASQGQWGRGSDAVVTAIDGAQQMADARDAGGASDTAPALLAPGPGSQMTGLLVCLRKRALEKEKGTFHIEC